MRGGKRNGAGRKPCTDKKQQLTLYVLTSQIEKLGKDEIRQVCEKAINEAFSKQHTMAKYMRNGALITKNKIMKAEQFLTENSDCSINHQAEKNYTLNQKL